MIHSAVLFLVFSLVSISSIALITVGANTDSEMNITAEFPATDEPSSKGSIIILADSNITSALAASPYWLIKFYTPWCKHCKLLRPVFKQLAAEAPAGVNIAQVDCTKQKKSAEAFKVERYPTIMYKHGDSIGIYEGPRDLEGFHRFLERMMKPAYVTLDSVSDIPDDPSTDHVTFALLVNSANIVAINKEADEKRVVDIFHKLAANNKQDVTFAVVDLKKSEHDKDLYLEPLQIVKFDHGKPVLLMPNPLEAALGDLEDFISSNNYPLINEFDNHNFKRLSGLNKLIIMAVIDPRKVQQSALVLRIFDEQVHSMEDEAADYIFGHLDGIKWRSFIKMYHTMVPSVLVLDQSNELHHTFYLQAAASSGNSAGGSDAEEHAIKEEIAAIFASLRDHTVAMEWNETLPPTMTQKILYRFKDYYPWSLAVFILPAIFLIMSLMNPYPKEKKEKRS